MDTQENNHLVNIEIDGKKIQIRAGAMLIEAADEAGGNQIPRFCYHKGLSIAANCRMCLVEVEKAPKPLPACATPVSEGMRVFTKSDITKASQKAVMEFLLINHPLDCPVCDQGGECELQDVALEYGKDKGHYNQAKRVVKDKDIGPLVETEMTRCIHCTRCVRFGDEIAGVRELGAVGRGEHMEIRAYLEQHLNSELSGNVIDLCPVGALTSKPFRFKARAWELYSRASVAMHDCVGSHIFAHTFRNKVLRVIPRENMAINENWLSDRDRFGYEGVNHSDRLLSPQIKENGQWQTVSWEVALSKAAQYLNNTPKDKLGALASPSNATEDYYVLQKLMRSLGSDNIDHRLQTADFRDQEYLASFPSLGRTLQSLETCDQVLLIGGYTRKEQPMLNHRLRKGTHNNMTLVTLVDYTMDWNLPVAHEHVVQAGDYITPLLTIINILSNINNSNITNTGTNNDSIQKLVNHFCREGEHKAIILGTQVLSHPQLAIIRYLTHKIAQLLEGNVTVGELPLGANVPGAWLSGAIPHRVGDIQKTGLSAKEMLKNPLETYLLMNIEPEYDCLNPKEALDTLKQANEVILLTPYVTQTMLEYASVLLPITPSYEMAGSMINIEGHCYSMEPASTPQGLAWPSWKILNRIAQLLELEGFTYHTSQEVMRDVDLSKIASTNQNNKPVHSILEQLVELSDNLIKYTSLKLDSSFIRLAPRGSLTVDNIVRRASSLQKTQDAQNANSIYMHPITAENFNVKARFQVIQNGSLSMESFKIHTTPAIPPNSILLHSGLTSTRDLGAPYQSIELVQLEI